jgi:hypothetical protein
MGWVILLLGSLTWLGCAPDPGTTPLDAFEPTAEPFVIHVSSGEFLSTVATVTWDWAGDELDAAWLEVSAEGSAIRIVDASLSDAVYTGTVIGLKPLTEYTLSAKMEHGVTRYASNDAQLITGGLPTQIPDTELSVGSDTDAPEGFVVTSILCKNSTAVILDRDGEVVWWHDNGGLEGIISRARVAHDGRSIIYLWADGTEGSGGENHLVRVGLDGGLLESTLLLGGHHDFVELPDGTVAFLFQESRIEDDGGEILCDCIVELDRDSGDLKQVWSSFDSMPTQPHSPGPGHLYDWTHANALDYDPIRDTYAVSLWVPDTIITIDRATGELLEQVGGLDGDYALVTNDDRFFEGQHQFEFLGDHLLVFDNGPPEDVESRAVEFSLDADRGEAKIEWVHTGSSSLFSGTHGDVNRLMDGSTLITWSLAGRQELVSVDGETLWQVDLEMGHAFGYTTLIEDLPLFSER